MATWLPTAPPDDHRATADPGSSIPGLQARDRNRALEVEPGDVLRVPAEELDGGPAARAAA